MDVFRTCAIGSAGLSPICARDATICLSSWRIIREAGLGPHQLRPRAVRGEAADHVGEGGAGGCAAQVEIAEGGAQFEEGRALAAGKLARGGDIGYIKPDNVLLNDYGEPVLSDFGLAHISGGFKTASSRLYTPTSPTGCDDGDHSSAPLLIPRFDHHAVADDDCNVANSA